MAERQTHGADASVSVLVARASQQKSGWFDETVKPRWSRGGNALAGNR
ncbi:hypothetical protein [Streptomyces sp. NPDC090445]